MTRREAKRIIREENLEHYCFFKDRDEKPREVGIKKIGDRWCTYATDERCSIVTNSEFMYDTEEEALDSFIRRLRSLNELFALKKRRKQELIDEMRKAKLRR